MVTWGGAWLTGEAGPPVLYRHHACGEVSRVDLRCAHCGGPVRARRRRPPRTRRRCLIGAGRGRPRRQHPDERPRSSSRRTTDPRHLRPACSHGGRSPAVDPGTCLDRHAAGCGIEACAPRGGHGETVAVFHRGEPRGDEGVTRSPAGIRRFSARRACTRCRGPEGLVVGHQPGGRPARRPGGCPPPRPRGPRGRTAPPRRRRPAGRP